MPAIAMPKPDPVDVGWMLMELKLCAGYHYFAYYLGDSGDGYALVETKGYIGFSRACAIITDHGGRIIESKANIEGTGRGFIICNGDVLHQPYQTFERAATLNPRLTVYVTTIEGSDSDTGVWVSSTLEIAIDTVKQAMDAAVLLAQGGNRDENGIGIRYPVPKAYNDADWIDESPTDLRKFRMTAPPRSYVIHERVIDDNRKYVVYKQRPDAVD